MNAQAAPVRVHPGALLKAALAYAARGWHVFPLHSMEGGACTCGKEACGRAAKHPRTRHGLKEASADPEQVRRWWRQWPGSNIGIRTGPESGLVVLDIDPKNGGDSSLAAMVEERGSLPATVTARTGGGGQHFLFRYPEAVTVGSPVDLAGYKGIDVRGQGGYIVAAPSLHASGGQYGWTVAPEDVEALPLPPPWLLRLMTEKARKPKARKAAGPGAIGEGERNAKLTSIAGKLRRDGLEADALEAALHKVNEKRCNPPLDVDEVARIAASVSRYEPVDEPAHSLTDTGNAGRFATQHGEDVRYVPAWGWLVWDGKRWVRDEGGLRVRARMMETARNIYLEAPAATDLEAQKAIGKWALQSQNAGRIQSALTLAEPSLAARPDDFDADPWLLNVENGTLDLRTGELREHRHDDLITRVLAVPYRPEARLEKWDAFLRDVTGGDDDLGVALQRAAGYSLTGSTREEVLFFVHGPPASGKTTFIEAFQRVISGYAVTADFETFLKRNDSGGARGDIARLAGARFVASVEVDQGKRLAEGLVKQLTGGDRVTARHLYASEFEFTMQAKLWLVANDAPRARDDDDALWRRIRVIPFAHSIPPERRDPELKAALTDVEQAGPAILAWAVQGCLDWQRSGLGRARAVDAATAAYRTSMDPLADFLEECCVLDAGAKVPSAALYHAYEEWAKDAGLRKPLSRRAFTERLKKRKDEDGREEITTSKDHRGARLLKGIGLRSGWEGAL